MSKSTRKQNLTGNRYHAPKSADYNEKFSDILAQRIYDAGHWDFVDVDSLKMQFPGLWHMVCEKTRALRAASNTIEVQLRAGCVRREQERFQSL